VRRPPRSLWPARLAWTIGIAGFLAGAAYVIGGPRIFRLFRSRALLESAAAEPISTVDTAAQTAAQLVIAGAEPLGVGQMVLWLTAILLSAVLLLLMSARWRG
jgi:glucose uptake protein GlcU